MHAEELVDQRLQAPRHHDHAFQAVGRFGGFDDGNLSQVARGLRRLCGVDLLLALVLAQRAQRRHLQAVVAQSNKEAGRQRLHALGLEAETGNDIQNGVSELKLPRFKEAATPRPTTIFRSCPNVQASAGAAWDTGARAFGVKCRALYDWGDDPTVNAPCPIRISRCHEAPEEFRQVAPGTQVVPNPRPTRAGADRVATCPAPPIRARAGVRAGEHRLGGVLLRVPRQQSGVEIHLLRGHSWVAARRQLLRLPRLRDQRTGDLQARRIHARETDKKARCQVGIRAWLPTRVFRAVSAQRRYTYRPFPRRHGLPRRASALGGRVVRCCTGLAPARRPL